MAIAQSSSPLGVDHFGRPFDWVNDPGRPEDMTSEEFDKWTSMYYDDTPAPSSPGKSPDSPRPSTHVNQVTSSPSSEDGHLEFTPSSTALDSLNDVGNVDDADLISAYTTSPSEDYEFITPFSSRSSDYLHVAQPASHVSDATIASAYRPSASPGDFLPVPSPQQWSSFTTTNSDGSDLALQQESVAQYGFDNNTSTPSSGFHADFSANTTLPLRPMPSSQPPPAAHTQSFPIYGTSWGNVQQSFTYQEHQSNALTTPQTPLYMNHNYVYQPAIIQLPTAAVSFSGLPSSDQRRMDLTQPTTIPVQPPLMNSPANCGADGHTPRAQLKLFQSPRKRTLHHAAVKAEQSRTLVPRQGPRPIAAAGLPNGVPLQEAPDTKQPRGGRKKHSHLTEQARKRSSVMRKKGACWRCRLQRDPCPDDGTPCARCLHVITSQKGQQYFFACDRSKLPDFVLDFLPPSFTTMHSKQNIEDCVQDQVQIWDHTRPVEVFLTSGYGPPLRWILHEFQPATMELMAQFQYLQNPHTRQSVRHEKWSPPLGVMRLEPSDDWHFKNYLDELMTDEHLIHFPWRCFEEESQIDDFQAELLALMCRLYQATNDIDLQFLLQKLIRMMIITYIMAHTLTITEDSLLGIHAFVRNPNKPTQPQPYTSPRLANRQLKFFFHMLRQQIFDEILKWQQATLCASSGKDSTWLSSFVVILTFAMVLEEIQRTMHIQADAKARKRECSFDAAQQEARNACERIDDRFGLLVGLFQCKYRDKKWNQEGSFGAQTPRLRDADEHLFCKDVRDLLEEKRDLLTDRKAVPFAFQNQCYYTSRLVARFLLPFLDLPA